jgi:hypothetical protein
MEFLPQMHTPGGLISLVLCDEQFKAAAAAAAPMSPDKMNDMHVMAQIAKSQLELLECCDQLLLSTYIY